MQQEVFAGKLRPAHGNRRRIDQDVVAEEVGQNGEAAGGLHPQPLDALAGRCLDKRRPGAQFVGDPPRLLAAACGTRPRSPPRCGCSGEWQPTVRCNSVLPSQIGCSVAHNFTPGGLPRVDVDFGGILAKDGHDLVVHQHGTCGEAVPAVVFLQAGRSLQLCQALFGQRDDGGLPGRRRGRPRDPPWGPASAPGSAIRPLLPTPDRATTEEPGRNVS